jgi:hypothetical protein
MEWQPIDSAPKDGSLVDLWWEGVRFVDCFWMNYNPSFPTRTVGWICAKTPGTPFSLSDIKAEPSHWMIVGPPSDVEAGIPIYASHDATDDVLGEEG